MNETIKKRLIALENAIKPVDLIVSVDLPSGNRKKMFASEWWEHRREWPLSDFSCQDTSAGIFIFLVFADLSDRELERAQKKGDLAEVERLTNECDEWLARYFGDSP